MSGSNESKTGTSSSEEVPVLLCAKCGLHPRARKGASWCKECYNVAAAEYRLKARPRETFEDRICELPGCKTIFRWGSTHPKQRCCSKSHSERLKWQERKALLPQPPDGKIYCSKFCQDWLPVDQFPRSRWNSKKAWCSACLKAYGDEWAKTNSSRRSAASRRLRVKKLLIKYGAPSDDYDTLLQEQGNVCASCGYPSEKTYHVDHDHNKPEAESYRGLICSDCNPGLGYFHDDPARLRAAAAYLEGRVVPA